MDLLFPPVRVATGQALDAFVGHVFVPLSTMKDAQVDFFWLAVELIGIVAAAVAAWALGSAARVSLSPGRDAKIRFGRL